MKKMRKIFALLIAMVMVLGMATSVFAAKTTDSSKGGSASIAITLPTDNAGTDEEITYTVYKVFDATQSGSAIAYQIDSANGDLTAAMTAAGFSVDTAGNVSGPTGDELSDTAIAAIAAYAQDSIGTFTAKPSDGTLTITGLEYGYYYITTTTGTAVTVDSTNPNATVEDKNTIPGPPDKTVTGVSTGSYDDAGKEAIAQVGSTVNFKVVIKKVKGATNYVFHDTMTAGLTYNNDVAVTPAAVVDNTTTAAGDTVTVTFKNDELAKLEDNTDITITYSATVISDALQDDPAHNTAKLDYGNGHTTEMDQVDVFNAKFTVTKSDGENQPLAGAGFIVQSAGGGYYKIDGNPAVVTWVDSSDDATEYTSDASGAVTAFTGLADGTYTLIEKTVPSGYNRADDYPFTVNAKDSSAANLQQSATVVNNAGTELPSTGGVGTTIFYIIGAALVLGAGVVLVTRRRMSN